MSQTRIKEHYSSSAGFLTQDGEVGPPPVLHARDFHTKVGVWAF